MTLDQQIEDSDPPSPRRAGRQYPRRRVEEQSQRINEFQDTLHTLSIAVQYQEEEPSLAFLAERGIAGQRRVALMMAIAGVLSRAQAEALPLSSGAHDEILPDYPALAEAYSPEPIDGDEAVRIVGEVLAKARKDVQCSPEWRMEMIASRLQQNLTAAIICSGTYFWHEDCVFLQTTAVRPSSFKAKVRPRDRSQSPIRAAGHPEPPSRPVTLDHRHGQPPCTAVGAEQSQRAPPFSHPQPGHMPSTAAPTRLPSGQSPGGKDERV